MYSTGTWLCIICFHLPFQALVHQLKVNIISTLYNHNHNHRSEHKKITQMTAWKWKRFQDTSSKELKYTGI